MTTNTGVIRSLYQTLKGYPPEAPIENVRLFERRRLRFDCGGDTWTVWAMRAEPRTGPTVEFSEMLNRAAAELYTMKWSHSPTFRPFEVLRPDQQAKWVGRAQDLLRHAAPPSVLEIALKLAQDPHREDHLMKVATGGWTLQHPVAERITGDLFNCPVMKLEETDQIVSKEWENDANCAGVYRVWVAGQFELGMELLEDRPEWEDPQ